MDFTCVGGSGGIPIVILLCQSRGQRTEPQVVRQRGADPYGTRMILVCRAIALAAAVRRGRIRQIKAISPCDVLSCPEELCRFQQHFYNVAVAVPPCGLLRIQ